MSEEKGGFDQSYPEPESSKRPVDLVVFGVTAFFVLGVLVWGLRDGGGFQEVMNSTLGWITSDLGWLFLIAASGFVVFVIYLALSKFGRIRLGRENEAPEFSTISWIAMMFSAGMGIGLMFYGVNEPLTHFVKTPPGATPGVKTAMATTLFHWGFHPWAIYAVVGLSIAYSTYRCGRTQLVSAVFAPLLGSRVSTSVGGKVIDILAIFATLFGTTASLGLGALQIGAGIKYMGWMQNPSKILLVVIVVVLTIAFIFSAVSGLDKGVQWLSNVNMVAALALAVFVFVVGPTVFILNLIPTSIGSYIGDFMSMSGRSGAMFLPNVDTWLASWSIFYWAWWVSWTPFVGLFLAKISRGRTIREFVVGVMLVPTLVSLVWFAIFGGTGIKQEHDGVKLSESADAESQLFTMLHHLPLSVVASAVVMFLIAVFFVSGADAASMVMGTLSQRGEDHPARWLVIFWGSITGAVAALLLYISESALDAIQSMTIIAAVPFVIVMIGMCVCLYLDLREDPIILAQSHRREREHEKVRQVVASDIIDSDREVL